MDNLKIKLKNITNGRKIITQKINSYEEYAIVNDQDILELLQYHPTKQINISNIDYLQIKLHPTWKGKTLSYKYKDNNKIDDIAYVQCIYNLFGKYNRAEQYEKDIMNALRNESHSGTKRQFFINNTTIIDGKFVGCCANCNIKTNNITTDHYPITYQEIIDNFISINGLVLLNQDIYETNNCELKLKNIELA